VLMHALVAGVGMFTLSGKVIEEVIGMLTHNEGLHSHSFCAYARPCRWCRHVHLVGQGH